MARPGLVVQLWLRSARVQRRRAVLTVAAIAWGSVSLLLLLAFGEGLRLQMQRGRAGMGSGIAVIWPGETGKPFKGLPPGRPVRVRPEDLDLLRERVPGATVAGEMATGRSGLTVGKKTVNARVVGAEPAFETLRNMIPRAGGRYLNRDDLLLKRRVVFLGDELATDLFGKEEPVGRTVKVAGLPYTVVGVLRRKIQMGMYGGPDATHAHIPLSVFRAQFGRQTLGNIIVQPDRPERMKAVLDEVRAVLGGKLQFDPRDDRALGIWDTVETAKVMTNILIGIQLFLGIIGGLTLVIGGIGVANIMFAVVQERTKEIGVKMALGARRSWITGPLVLESLAYTATGGLLGLLISVALIGLLGMIPTEGNEALEFLGKPTLSVPIGLASAAILGAVGLLAGYFPARRAASVDPAATLRTE